MISIIATIVILGVLIFVHELGHFATAKWANIEVPRFSIGLGPKMMGFTRGETEYVIGWLPLGGYVRMAGMDDMEGLEGEHDAEAARSTGRDFESKSLATRAVVISAGVIMNMLFAWFLFAVIAMVWGVRETPEPVVGDVVEERLTAETRGLLDVPIGARITAVNGRAVENWSDVEQAVVAASDTIRYELAGGPAITVPVPANDTARAMLAVAIEPRVHIPTGIATVVEGSPAERAGLEAGDRVVEVAGQPVAGWQEMVQQVEARPGQVLAVTVERNGGRVSVTLTPDVDTVAAGAVVSRVGIGRTGRLMDAYPRPRLGPIDALVHGAEETWRFTALILDYLGGLFTGEASARDVGGPILIYQISDQMVQLGMDAYLNFMALFSINLAILNLLPIPILDGGQLMFLAVEGVRGRALSLDQRMRLSQVGLVLVVAIMVWALANDVLRLFGI